MLALGASFPWDRSTTMGVMSRDALVEEDHDVVHVPTHDAGNAGGRMIARRGACGIVLATREHRKGRDGGRGVNAQARPHMGGSRNWQPRYRGKLVPPRRLAHERQLVLVRI